MPTITEPRDILIQGICAKWQATPALTGAMAGVWQGDRSQTTTANPSTGGSPPNSHFPYVVIPDTKSGGGRSSRFASTCGNDYWRHEIHFRLYHKSYAECAALAKLVNDVFRPRSLSLTLAAGEVVKNQFEDVLYREESKGVHYADLIYEFETSFPVQ